MIERKITQKIKYQLNNFPAVAILGARQIGKTTLAKHVSKLLNKDTLHIDLELPTNIAPLLNNPELFLEQNKEKCVIIDEVQRMPSLFPILRPLIDNHKIPGRFLLLGSSSPILLKESSESLAGRIIYTELASVNLLEIDFDKDFMNLWLYGGFPEPYLNKNEKWIKDWYSSFISTYFERDLKILGLDMNPNILYRIFTMLSHIQGTTLNISKISSAIGIDRRTFDRILWFFINSYMFGSLLPFHYNTKKRLVKSPKYYVRHSGMFHHILNINNSNDLLQNPLLGASWEGFVVEQILSSKLNIQAYFYRTQAGAECDLVLVDGDRPKICIEAKVNSSPKITKSLIQTITDLQTNENFIVIPNCNNPYPIRDNIIVCGLPWLLQELNNKYEGVFDTTHDPKKLP